MIDPSTDQRVEEWLLNNAFSFTHMSTDDQLERIAFAHIILYTMVLDRVRRLLKNVEFVATLGRCHAARLDYIRQCLSTQLMNRHQGKKIEQGEADFVVSNVTLIVVSLLVQYRNSNTPFYHDDAVRFMNLYGHGLKDGDPLYIWTDASLTSRTQRVP
jgi:hypothetical protein